MDKARKQRVSGLIALVLLFALYVAWTQRPQILLHYDAQGSGPVSYSFKENGVETLAGDIKPGEVRSFPLSLWRSAGYLVSFTFHRGAEKYASFSSRPGYDKQDLFLGPGLEVSTQPIASGSFRQQQ
ncbi:hypothetical protein [Pseudomonas panipatensis]|uniref:Uncharacterized protein n=1 Tax=Pseudomonas panipatensis TaxID=428992 RepID=A0A1G8FIQ3_9PSED|nr:hypothetical protein [Pseudomonas panipatensis]SDH82034.1 hypothetical protein SAMN05216272_103270 [Pseudomonas panipatensis]SMP53435.1 hypothetical protein SAMN06295951_103189 [Pseudomonas panipatensis]